MLNSEKRTCQTWNFHKSSSTTVGSSRFIVESSAANFAKYQIEILIEAALKELPSSGNSLLVHKPVFDGVYVLNDPFRPFSLQHLCCKWENHLSCSPKDVPSSNPDLLQYPRVEASNSFAVPKKIVCIGSRKHVLTLKPGMWIQGVTWFEIET